jgi:hypothetical protein
VLLLLLPSSNTDFEARKKAGDAVQATPKGEEYIIHVARAMGTAVKACTSSQSAPSKSSEGYTLVANVMHDGVMVDIEIQPSTKAAECIALNLSKLKVPPPPFTSSEHIGYPVTITFKINN